MTLKLEWKLSNSPLADIGFAIANTILELVNQQLPDLAELFPFKGKWELQGYLDQDWLVVRLSERFGSGVPVIGKLKPEELNQIKSKILPFEPRSHLELFRILGNGWFSFHRFTYVGPYKSPYACWPDLSQHLIDWLNHLVIPEVLRRNETRILRAIPRPPQFDIKKIRSACWVLECEKSFKQGTAFFIENDGLLVSCQHVLGPETVAFHPDEISKKYPVNIVKQDAVIDIAILKIDKQNVQGLSVGSADNLNLMDHIAVAGYPNYRYGDTGVIIPGLVVGFRIVSGIRRILTNAPIVAGNSGGPVVGSHNQVIGIAVTGAESMEKSQETENHGIIPIDALKYLIRQ